MASESLQGITAGTEVAIVSTDGGGDRLSIAKVEKVSPSGRFSVTWGGATLQFSANGRERTSDVWHRKTMLPLTEERRKRITESRERERLTYQLQHFRWNALPLETLRAVAELLAVYQRAEG